MDKARSSPETETTDIVKQLREKAKWRSDDIHGDLHNAAADEIERLRSLDQMSFVEAMSLAERGLEIWRAKEHNAKWWRKIYGTPIPNDLLVNISEGFA